MNNLPNGGYVGTAELYNPSTGKFSVTGSLNTVRLLHKAELLGSGEVLIVDLIAVLDPEVIVRIDKPAARPGAPRVIRGAKTWAKRAYTQLPQSLQPMLADGTLGLVWAPEGRLSRVLRFSIASGKIVDLEIIADPERLRELDSRLLSRYMRVVCPV
jgi:hypothetical protein